MPRGHNSSDRCSIVWSGTSTESQDHTVNKCTFINICIGVKMQEYVYALAVCFENCYHYYYRYCHYYYYYYYYFYHNYYHYRYYYYRHNHYLLPLFFNSHMPRGHNSYNYVLQSSQRQILTTILRGEYCCKKHDCTIRNVLSKCTFLCFISSPGYGFMRSNVYFLDCIAPSNQKEFRKVHVNLNIIPC